jgi:hypothetical protein
MRLYKKMLSKMACQLTPFGTSANASNCVCTNVRLQHDAQKKMRDLYMDPGVREVMHLGLPFYPSPRSVETPLACLQGAWKTCDPSDFTCVVAVRRRCLDNT